MGVKSTVRLTRKEVVDRIVTIQMEWSRRLFEGQYSFASNEELENTLELLNDRRAGGEGFENYIIDEESAG